MNKATSTNPRAQFSIERTYAASIESVWELWTTKPGIELWWGPEGFDVTVTSIDLKPGGQLGYRIHEAPGHAAFHRVQGHLR